MSVEDNIAAASLAACSSQRYCATLTGHGTRSRALPPACGQGAGTSIRRCGAFPAATSRRCCWPVGWRADPEVLIVDEPTRGVDVGAKGEIHRMLRDYAEAGNGVIVVSSEMPEVLGLCDRIIVMRHGAIQGALDSSEATEERLVALALGQVEAPC